MRPLPAILAFVLNLGLLLPLGSSRNPQDDRAAAERSLQRFQAYLAQRPFHDQGFERLVTSAVELNRLGELIAELEAQRSAGGASETELVILARLYARTDRPAEALATLEALESSDAAFARNLDRLRGTLLLEVGRTEEGLERLDALAAQPVPAAADTREVESLHALRAEAALRLGDRERAARAFADLAAADPTSFDLALDVADRLARSGLLEQADARYAAALALAGDDAPRRCRALAALGELQERRDAPASALAAYEEARSLLGRGHWLKRTLEARLLAVHTRQGTLADLVATLRTELAARPGELDTRVLLAKVLLAQKDVAGARTVLQDATLAFPRDLALGRELVEVLRIAKDDEARVAELQRLVTEHPRELELYIELGRVLASSGKLEQARLQWERTLQGRLTDPGLCLRLAALHSHHGLFDSAEDLIERALALEPLELGHFDELARLAVRAGQRERVAGILDRAEAAAGEVPAQLEIVAQLADAQRDSQRALRLFERAAALSPTDARLTFALADQLRRVNDPERAAALLREVAGKSTDAQTLRDAVDRLVRLRRSNLEALRQSEVARLAAAPDDRAAHLIVARCAEEQRDLTTALTALDALLQLDPTFSDAIVRAAQIEERLGRDEAAIGRYRALLGTTPQQRIRWLGDLGRLYQRLDLDSDALACFEELVRLSPDNPATFREAARAFEALDAPGRARDCLRQALRLRPDDGDLKLALATLLNDATVEDEPRGKELADELARSVARSADRDLATRARAWLYERLEERGEVRATLERLRAEVRQNPFDTERALDVIDFLVREDEFPLALELLDDLARYQPDEPKLLRERSKLLREMRRFDAALADIDELLRLPDQDRDELLVHAAECELALGRVGRAEERLQGVGDQLRVATFFQRERLFAQARGVLESELQRRPEDTKLLERYLENLRQSGDHTAALDVLQRIEALAPVTTDSLLRRADLVRSIEGRDAYIALMTRALLTIEPPIGPAGDAAKSLTKGEKRALRAEKARVARESQAVYARLSQTGEWRLSSEIAARAALEAPLRADLFEQGLSHFIERTRFSDAETLIRLGRTEHAAGRAPVGESLERWAKRLDAAERRLTQSDPARAAARAAELAAAIDGDPAALTMERIKELTDLHRRNGDTAALQLVLEAAVERLPNDMRVRANLTSVLLEAGDHEAAIVHLRRMLEKDGASPAIDPLRANRKDRERFAKKLSDADAAALTDEHVERSRRLNARAGVDTDWSFNLRPSQETVQVALAAALAKLDDLDGARELLRSLEPTHPEHLARGFVIATAYTELGLTDEAQRLQAQLRDAALRALDDPILRQLVPVTVELREVMAAHGKALARSGALAEGFELVRRWNSPDAARELMEQLPDPAVAASSLAATLRSEWAAANSDQATAGASADLDRAVLAFEGALLIDDLAGARAIADTALERAPTSIAWIQCTIDLCQRSGDVEGARALLERSIAEVQAAVRASGKIPTSTQALPGNEEGPAFTPPYGLEPRRLPSNASPIASQLAQVARYLPYQPALSKPAEYVPWELVVRKVELDWERSAWDEVAMQLQLLLNALGGSGNWISYNLREACASVPRNASALALWKVVYELEPSDVTGLTAYGAALEDSGATDEAVRLYSDFVRTTVAKGQTGDARAKAIVERLRSLDPSKLPVEFAPPADLASAIAADPLNISLRRAYLEELLTEKRYDAAADEAAALAPLAGHLDETIVRCGDALFAAGRDAEFLELMAPRLSSLADDDQRIGRGALVATLLLDLGREPEALAALRTAFESGRRSNYHTSAAIWLARGETARAAAELKRKREELVNAGETWLLDEVDTVLTRLEGRQSRSFAGLEQLLDEAGSPTTVSPELVMELVEWLGAAADATAPAELRALAEKRGGAQRPLLEALALRAEGKHEAYEEALVELGLARRADRSVALLAVSHARERGELQRARALLDRVAAAAPPNPRRKIETSVGELPEDSALEVERAALDLALGADTPAGVLARWRDALKDHPELVFLFAFHAALPEAAELAATLPPIGPLGAPTRARLEAERAAAELEVERGDPGAAFERLMALERVQSPDVARWHRLVELARELGRLGELRELAVARGTAAVAPSEQLIAAAEVLVELDGHEPGLRTLAQWSLGKTPRADLWRALHSQVRELSDGIELERQLLERLKERNDRDFYWREGRWRLVELQFLKDGTEAGLLELTRGDSSNDGYARTQCARFLHEQGHTDFALEVLRNAVDPSSVRAESVRLLIKSGAVEDAWAIVLEQLDQAPLEAVYLIGPNERQQVRELPSFVAACAAARADLEAAADDAGRIEALRRITALERIQHVQAADRLAALNELAAAAPRDPRVLAWLGEDLVAAKQLDEAVRYLEARLDHEDRTRAISNQGWTMPNVDLVRQRVQGWIERDGDSAIARILSDRLGCRFGVTSSWMHTVNNLDRSFGAGRLHALAFEFGDLAHYLELASSDAANDRNPGYVARARLRTGDSAGALDLAWQSLSTSDGSQAELWAALFGEADQLADLEQRLVAWLADPTLSSEERDKRWEVAHKARRHSAQQRGAFDELVALERTRVARRSWDPGAHEALAEALLRSGAYAEGYSAACAAHALRERALVTIARPFGVRVERRWTPGGPVRFHYAAAATTRSDAQVMRSSGLVVTRVLSAGDEEAESTTPTASATMGVDLRLELALLSGQRDAALALEAERVEANSRGVEAGQLALASALLKWDLSELDGRAAELLQSVEAGTEDMKSAEAAAQRLGELAERRGDTEAAARWTAAAAAHRQRSGAKPSPAPGPLVRGLRLLDAGDAEGALALLQEHARAERRAGRYGREDAGLLHGLAQARARVEGAAAARGDLLRALAEHPLVARAAATRAALGR